jgi:hypothetical protein
MTAVDTPFYLFFGIMGLVAGGLIVWFLMIEHPFENAEIRGGPVDQVEVPLLVKSMADDGVIVDEAIVARVIELHEAYFDGRIYDSLVAAENARIEAERARLIAAEYARREAARLAAEAATAAAAAPAPRPARRRRAGTDRQS